MERNWLNYAQNFIDHVNSILVSPLSPVVVRIKYKDQIIERRVVAVYSVGEEKLVIECEPF